MYHACVRVCVITAKLAFTPSRYLDAGLWTVKTRFRSSKSLTVAKWLLTPKSATLNHPATQDFFRQFARAREAAAHRCPSNVSLWPCSPSPP